MPEEGSSTTGDLVNRTRKKDDAAFLELAARYGRYFRWYFISHRVPVTDAEDLAVELIGDIVLSKIDSFRGDEDGFRSWVITLMKHECANWHRRARRQFEPLCEELGKVQWGPPERARTGRPTPERQQLSEAFGRLTSADRETLRMRYFDGFLSTADLARALGRKEVTVRQRVRRALDRLRALMEEEGSHYHEENRQ
jgi:RNA polymerase sigma factor (sigma-70 family)